MNKNLCIFFLCVTASFSSLCPWRISGQGTINGAQSPDEPLTVSGNANITNASFKEVMIHGHLDAKNLRVGQCIVVNGHIEADGLIVKRLECKGSCSLRQGTVTESAIIYGSCHLIKTEVGKVELTSEKGNFTDCTLENLTVKPNKGGWEFLRWIRSIFGSVEKDEQTIYLQGNTHVAGDIVFQGGHGIVRASNETEIDGTVIGGCIIRE